MRGPDVLGIGPRSDPGRARPVDRDRYARRLMLHETLWRHSDFMKLWAGQTISALGSVVTRTAIPLVALCLD